MQITHKRSGIADKAPQTTDLALGELAINTHDGKLFLKKDNGTESVVLLNPDIPSIPTFATQAEAEGGAASGVLMDPLRTAQAISALGSSGGSWESLFDGGGGDASAITVTGLSGYSDVRCCFYSPGLAGWIYFEAQNSGGAWRSLYRRSLSSGYATGGLMHIHNFNQALPSMVVHMVDQSSSTNYTYSDYNTNHPVYDPLFIRHYAAACGAVDEAWQAFRLRVTSGSLSSQGTFKIEGKPT